MKKYLSKIEKLVDDLKKNPNTSSVIFDSGKGINNVDFEDYSEEFRVSIADEIKELYSEIDGFKIEWKYIKSDPLIKFEGYINILPFYKMFLGNDDNLWEDEIWNKNMTTDELTFLKNLKIFDYFDRDNVHCVCLELSKNTITQNMWIFRKGSEPIPLKIGIKDYMKHLITLKGFWGWQYLFSSIDFSKDENIGLVNGIKESIELWSSFIPKKEFEKIKEKFEKMITKKL